MTHTQGNPHQSVCQFNRSVCVWLFAAPWTAARQASLPITNSQSPPKPMSIELVMPSSYLILCRPLLLLPSIFPGIWVFSNDQLFVSGGQSIGVSISTSVLPMNTQDWFPLGWTGWEHAAERSYPASEVRGGRREELPCAQGNPHTSWFFCRNFPLSLTHVPPALFTLPPQEKMLPFCVLSEPFLLSAGHRDPGKSQGGRCTSPWVSPKEGGSRAQADPRPHCPPRRPGGVPRCCGGWGVSDSLAMFLQAQGAPALHIGETVIVQCLKRL